MWLQLSGGIMIGRISAPMASIALVVLTVGGANAAVAVSPAVAAKSVVPVTAYVPNYKSTAGPPISTATNRAGKPIKVGIGPLAIALTPNGKTAYVTATGSISGGDPGTVTPISTAPRTPR